MGAGIGPNRTAATCRNVVAALVHCHPWRLLAHCGSSKQFTYWGVRMLISSFQRPLYTTLAHVYCLGSTFVPSNCKVADFDNVPAPMQLLCYGTPCIVDNAALQLFFYSWCMS